MIFFKKEKEVIDLIGKHADTVEECLSVAEKTLLAYLEKDIAEAKKLARNADNVETKADMIVYPASAHLPQTLFDHIQRFGIA